MIGQKISHYRIEVELGRGGMGVAYGVRGFALKLLPIDELSTATQRFCGGLAIFS
jgi:hypothetical protein